MHFKGFTLDSFQEEAIHAIKRGHSVVVSAATGTGKTLVADYVIDKYLKKNRKVIYTAPIKALSNQKFKDFKRDYGPENVGIMTGDVVINPHAPILIMTTEIYRNMLLVRDPLVEEVEYVVFDEIHYMNDPERGAVWEESLIFSPQNVRFLCLSATIPNVNELSSWIETIKEHTMEVVRNVERAVPLKHYVYESWAGLTTAEELVEDIWREKKEEWVMNSKRSNRRKKLSDYQPASPKDVINEMDDKLPAIVFSFSRKACEREAVKLSKKRNFVSSDEDHRRIVEVCREHFTPEVNRMETTTDLRNTLLRGVGFHHAGLLPQHKAAVEDLFEEGIISALFATETFSLGVNMPAKTVIFNGLRKFDGRSFRMINSKEYFQLAGRAGRRGIDTVGYVVAIIDRRENNVDEFMEISAADTEPIRSQYKLSYNTVLNLAAQYDEEQIDTILKSTFDYFVRSKKSKRQLRVKASFNNKRRFLKKMGYLTEDDRLTEKGVFAQDIYFEELLISELFSSETHEQLSNTELLQVMAAIIYEPRPNDHFSFKGIKQDYKRIRRILKENQYVFNELNKLSLKRMMAIVGAWSGGAEFEELLDLTNLAEGDIIRLFRRIIDMIRQVKHAARDPELKRRMSNCQECIDRGLVSVRL